MRECIRHEILHLASCIYAICDRQRLGWWGGTRFQGRVILAGQHAGIGLASLLWVGRCLCVVISIELGRFLGGGGQRNTATNRQAGHSPAPGPK